MREYRYEDGDGASYASPRERPFREGYTRSSPDAAPSKRVWRYIDEDTGVAYRSADELYTDLGPPRDGELAASTRARRDGAHFEWHGHRIWFTRRKG